MSRVRARRRSSTDDLQVLYNQAWDEGDQDARRMTRDPGRQAALLRMAQRRGTVGSGESMALEEMEQNDQYEYVVERVRSRAWPRAAIGVFRKGYIDGFVDSLGFPE